MKSMKKSHFIKLIALSFVVAFIACSESATITDSTYTGTGSLTQGSGTTTTTSSTYQLVQYFF